MPNLKTLLLLSGVFVISLHCIAPPQRRVLSRGKKASSSTAATASGAFAQCSDTASLSPAEAAACAAMESAGALTDNSSAQATSNFALVEANAKPFATIFPGVSDRFLIASDNSVFYDYLHPDGSWDMESQAEKIKSGAIPKPVFLTKRDFSTPNPLNVLFPSQWGILQAQPTRMNNGLILMFFIDVNKNLKVISQLGKGTGLWQTIDQAVVLDTNIEFIVPLINSTGQIEIVYVKNKNDIQIVLSRTLLDETTLARGFGPVDVYKNLTKLSDMATLLPQVSSDMKNRGVMLISHKASDLKTANTLLAGQPSVGQQASPAAANSSPTLGLLGATVGGSYTNGQFNQSVSGQGSFGQSVSSSEGWSSPAAICANVATIVIVAAVLSTGPVGGMMMLGMASGLQSPEAQDQVGAVAASTASDESSRRAWRAASAANATENQVIIVPAFEADGQASTFVELTTQDLTNINSLCITMQTSIDQGTLAIDHLAVENVRFCQDFAGLTIIRSQNQAGILLGQAQNSGIPQPALIFKMTASAYAQYKQRYGQTNLSFGLSPAQAIAALNLLIPATGILFFRDLTSAATVVMGMYKGVKFLTPDEHSFIVSYQHQQSYANYIANVDQKKALILNTDETLSAAKNNLTTETTTALNAGPRLPTDTATISEIMTQYSTSLSGGDPAATDAILNKHYDGTSPGYKAMMLTLSDIQARTMLINAQAEEGAQLKAAFKRLLPSETPQSETPQSKPPTVVANSNNPPGIGAISSMGSSFTLTSTPQAGVSVDAAARDACLDSALKELDSEAAQLAKLSHSK